MLAILTFVATAWGAPLEIRADAGASHVMLQCGDKQLTQPVSAGVAKFAEAPADCDVYFVTKVGEISGPGQYACTTAGCALEDVAHRAVTDAAGRVNVVITGKYEITYLELTCPDGYRQRADIVENTVTFDGIGKANDCELHFKGGAPARFRPVAAGSYRCSLTGTTAVCATFAP